MSRFKCKSQLIISCVGLDLRTIKVRLNHHDNHIAYYDVALPPGASQIIRENLEWSTPVSVTPRVQAIYPHITGKQIHTAWTQMSETLWRRDKEQLPSAETLLREFGDDVDVKPTDNTNSKNLELYSVMGEYDNAGYPLSYCLLSTATALPIGKRTRALKAWGKCLRDEYGVMPKFAHTDKDMAEIGMLREVWGVKLQLC